MNLILVGHGSIGSKYKDVIIKYFSEKINLIIIENNFKVKDKLIKDGFKCYESLNQFRKLSNEEKAVFI